jgi:cytochrome b561
MSIGLTILALAVIRLVWRWINPLPELPNTLKTYEKVIARFTHGALYLILFAMPLTGWMSSSAHGIAVKWFGIFQVPFLVGKNPALSRFLLQTHFWLALVLGIIVFVHIAAALRHHYVLGDNTLQRMLPSGKWSPKLVDRTAANSRFLGR